MVLFISETYLKDNTPVNLNVDTKDLYSHVGTAQDLYSQNILGSKLYDSLRASIDEGTVSVDQTELLAKIQPMTLWWALWLAFPWLNFKVKSKAIQKTNSENGEAAELAEIKYLREDIKNRAEYYSERLKDYLMLSGNKFPDYFNPDLPVLPAHGSQFDSGFYFERTNGFPGDCCPPIDPQDIGIHPIN